MYPIQLDKAEPSVAVEKVMLRAGRATLRPFLDTEGSAGVQKQRLYFLPLDIFPSLEFGLGNKRLN